MKQKFKLLLFCLFLAHSLSSQVPQKQVKHNAYSWVSINTNFGLTKHWFVMADFHIRENNVFASNSFLFGRLGLGYRWQEQLSVVAGYANLLQPPALAGVGDRPDEHRIFQQAQLFTKYRKVSITQRLRNEQRWQSVLINGTKTGRTIFSNRVRYLLSGTISLTEKKWIPQLVVADEFMLQFGPQVIYNTFEQNRIFLGIKQKLGKGLSFDAGYMTVFQQKNSNLYTQSDVYRLFFYYSRLAKKK